MKFLALALIAIAPLHATPANADDWQERELCDPNTSGETNCDQRVLDAAQGTVVSPSGSRAVTERKISAEDLPVEAIRQIVRDYLIEPPKVLIEAQEVLRARHQARETERVEAAISANADELFGDPETPTRGGSEAAITLVEFFDYRCPHCRRAKRVLDHIVAADPDVRIIYKEFPILGPRSVLAARAALAARVQGKYLAFHDALMAAEGSFDREHIFSVAVSVGLDPDLLSRDMNDPAIDNLIERNQRLARALGVNSTPNFVLGQRLIRGAPNLKQLREMIAEVRLARADRD